MQRGSVEIVARKEGPAVWQFRWSEKDLHGARVQRKRVIGTVERHQDEAAARTVIAVFDQIACSCLPELLRAGQNSSSRFSRAIFLAVRPRG